jgi:phosphatidylglycerophosphatase A
MSNTTEIKSMRDACIDLLRNRGVELDQIATIVYDLQKKYVPNLTIKMCNTAIKKVLSKREVQNAVLTGIELDRLAEENLLSEPLQSLINDDNPLYGIDEILVLSICNIYGSIGLTNFGYVDKLKPGIIGELDKIGKETGKCHTFMDDIIGAIASAAASKIAHNAQDKREV